MDKKLISHNLTAIGESLEHIPVHVLKYLEEIQEVIDQKEQQQHEALSLIKSSSITVSSVMATLGYSRNTAYRYGGILQRYIEHASACLSKTNLLHTIEALRQEIRDKDKQLALVVESNVANLQLQDQVAQLEGVIADKNTRIEQLQKRVNELNREVSTLRSQKTKDKPAPIVFNPK